MDANGNYPSDIKIDKQLTANFIEDMKSVNLMIVQHTQPGFFNAQRSSNSVLKLKKLTVNLDRGFTDARAIKSQLTAELYAIKTNTLEMLNRIENNLRKRVVAASSWFRKFKSSKRALNKKSQRSSRRLKRYNTARHY